MAQQKLDLELKGLYTSPNDLSGVPPGALVVANNVVINSKNLIESRRGQTQYGSPLSVGMDQINKFFNYRTNLIINYADKMAYDNGAGVRTDFSGTYVAPSSDMKMRSLESNGNFYFTTSLGIFKIDSLTATPITAGVVRALSGTGTLDGMTGFLVDDSAVAYRLVWGYRDANDNLLLGAPSQRLVVSNSSGGSRDVELEYLIPDGITTNYFYQIYRSFGTATAADEPSDELQLILEGNPTAAEITANMFTVLDSTPYSLMRTTLYTSPSQEGIANSNYQPPLANDIDTYKNCAFYANTRQKQTLTITIISVGNPSLGYVTDATCATVDTDNTLTVTDTTVLRVGMRIVGTGIQTGTIIASITNATTLEMSLPATVTDASVSLEFQDRVTVANVNYWGGSTQDASTNTFLVDTGSTPGVNIDETTTNFVEIINTSTSTTQIYAYYLSSVDDLPGQILFEERSLGGDPFLITSTAPTSFSPTITDQIAITDISVQNPTAVTAAGHGLTTGDQITVYDSDSTPTIDGLRTVTVIDPNIFTVPVNVTVGGTTGFFLPTATPITSTNEVNINRVFISKPNQPEAVPIYRFFNVGSSNFPIQRCVALRDGVFFFKQDGIYRLTGEVFENFTVTLLDNTVVLKVSESAVAFNNQIFCFTTQGICAISDAGVQILSVPIEDTLLELSSEQFTNFSSASFGVAYESARLYIFCTVTDEEDEFATQAFVYNSLTNTWTKWIMDRTCGIVGASVNKLFMGETDTGQVLIERKSFTSADYADLQYAITIATVVSDEEITVASATNIVVGMTLVQSMRTTLILDVDGTTLTLEPVAGLIAGAATVYQPIQNKIQWTPIDADNPGILKQFSELTLFFKNAAFTEIEAGFSSNIVFAYEVVPIVNRGNNWGEFPWGEAPWGGAPLGQRVLRTYVPGERQRANWINLYLQTEQAFTGFSLQGVSLIYKMMSSRIK